MHQDFTMIRLCLLLLITVVAYGDDVTEQLKEIDDLFQDSGLEMKKSCSGIQGDLRNGCYECYLCDDERLKVYKVKTEKLNLVHRSCDTTTTLCCVPQRYFVVKSVSSCGVKVEGGVRTSFLPRDERSTVRSVLVGEYPWRAWVYRKGGGRPSEILCAATVIDESTEVVMTSAGCVVGHDPGDLAISFSRSLEEKVDVAAVIINENYSRSRPHVHDIALLRMSKSRERPPSWVSPVCLPGAPAMHATTCTTMSNTDCFINAVIPLEKRCAESGAAAGGGQMCAVAPAGDYAPEHGAALVCQDALHTQDFNYFVYGIALETSDSVTKYTDVFKYQRWINDVIS